MDNGQRTFISFESNDNFVDSIRFLSTKGCDFRALFAFERRVTFFMWVRHGTCVHMRASLIANASTYIQTNKYIPPLNISAN